MGAQENLEPLDTAAAMPRPRRRLWPVLRFILQLVLLLGLAFLLLFLVVQYTDLLEWDDLNPFAREETEIVERDQPTALVEAQSLQNENARLAALALQLRAKEERLDTKERAQQIRQNKLIAEINNLERLRENLQVQSANDRSRQERLQTLATYVGSSEPKSAALQLVALETQDIIDVLDILDQRAAEAERISVAPLLLGEMINPSEDEEGNSGFTAEQETQLRETAEQVLRGLSRYEREGALEVSAPAEATP